MKQIIFILTALFMPFLASSQFAENGQLKMNSSKDVKFVKSLSNIQPALGTTYNTAFGLRAGETSGLTIKHFIGNNRAIEGIIGLWHHGVNITVLYELHANAFGESGLNWYYGAGGHLAVQTKRSYYGYGHKRHNRYGDHDFGLGIDGILGLEYKIPEIPIAISADLKPYLEVISNGRIWGSLDPGLGIKFTF